MVDKSFWKRKKIFITGHTGFKGSWLCLWLHMLEASITGYSLPPPTNPSLYDLCRIDELLFSITEDIRDGEKLKQALVSVQPEIVIHLAAQPIVRESYKNPAETFGINIMGTVNLLEAVRACPSVRAVVNVTSDKCYENRECITGYRESDSLGGYDPYSSSKACSEIVASSYRNSFFNIKDYDVHRVGLATARAGNVIGGGDWSCDRLIPDCIKALMANNEILIRNPDAVRPWQHVLEPLSGYMLLAQKLCENGPMYSQAWNFGPEGKEPRTVEWIVKRLCEKWGGSSTYRVIEEKCLHEANYLKLDCVKAKTTLGWYPRWNEEKAIDKTIEWSKASREVSNLRSVLRGQVIQAAKEYYDFVYKKVSEGFKPGERICYGGRVFDDKELSCLIDASLDFWLTAGRFSSKFEKDLAEFLNIRYCSLVNSGSSANLLAFMALTSPELGDRRIIKGDEIITVAAGFPTTVAPIIQYGAVPVFIDVEIPGCNLDCSQLEQAVSPRTKAVMAAHTLGNPFDLEKVKAFCDRHHLWLIEDNCDSLGTRVLINGSWQYTGTVGDIGTSSFYPPHHITTGEGGAVYTNDPRLKQLIDSYRDWGRDCCCPPGKDNICKNRFSRKFSQLPYGYDHKYVYSHFGYNFKMTEMQAAVGCAQLDKLNGFVETRKRNWKSLHDTLSDLADSFVFPEPALNSDPSWFGFLMIVKEEASFTRNEIVNYLEAAGIQTRMLFAGNLTKHPCFDEMRAMGEGYKIVGELKNTDIIMERAFWIGVYPGMTDEKLECCVKNQRIYRHAAAYPFTLMEVVMKASDYIIKYLEAAGVTHIFGYIGGAVTHLIDSLYKDGNMRFVQFGHEQAAAFAASAYAKYTGRVGVAMATSGPGATNLITGIADAYFDSAPTVFITGQVNTYDFKYASNVRQRGFQETDIVSIVKPITKYCTLVDDINNLEKELVKSFSIALDGRKGPVLIDIPMDIQRQDIKISEESFVYSIKKESTEIDDGLLNNVLEMIKTSSFPLVLSGGGVRSSCAERNLVRFSELLGIPVVVSLMGKDSFPDDHKYFAGFIGAYGNRFGNLALSKSDCLLILGSRLDSRQTGNVLKSFHDKKIIWVDIDKNEIECGRIKPDISIIADVDCFLGEMLMYCKSRNISYENNQKILNGITVLKRLFTPLSELDRDHKNNWHYKVMKSISDFLDDSDAVCIDVGQNQMIAAQVLTIRKNQRFINSGGMAPMGYALPSAIAISLACGSRSVVIVGDGGLQMNIQELKMVSEYALPVIIIVFNNKSLGMIKQFQELYFEKRYSATDEENGYKSCDFARIALAYGINSITIDEKSNLEHEFDQVFNKSELPVLVEVVMNYQTFTYPKLEFNKPIEEIAPEVTKEEADIINNCFGR